MRAIYVCKVNQVVILKVVRDQLILNRWAQPIADKIVTINFAFHQ
jgi:hypothetical protein